MSEIKKINDYKMDNESKAKVHLLVDAMLVLKSKDYDSLKIVLENSDEETRREFKKGINLLLNVVEGKS